MTFQPGVSGNPGGKTNSKPFTEALWLELHRLADGECHRHPKGSLAWNVQRLALDGSLPAVREIRDTLQGKPNQAIEIDGDLTAPGYREWLAWVIADGVKMREALEAKTIDALPLPASPALPSPVPESNQTIDIKDLRDTRR